MRMRPAVRALRQGAWLLALVAVPAAAGVPAELSDMTHQLSTVWVPATAYGLTLIAAWGQKNK